MSPFKQKRTTIKDVANDCGVSIATVSRVISGKNRVNQALIDKVMASVQKLEYHPSRSARTLRNLQSSRKIGLILSDIENPFYTTILRGIEDVLVPQNYALVVGDSNENESVEMNNLKIMFEEEVSGIIMNTVTPSAAVYAALFPQKYPLVLFDRFPSTLPADMVEINNQDIAEHATAYLIGLGHTKICFLGYTDRAVSIVERKAGYDLALKKAGIPIVDYHCMAGNLKIDGGYYAVKQLFANSQVPTAILAANNQTTIGAIKALAEADVHIPDDVSIIGFDDMAWVPAFRPPLTMVDQHPYHMGRMVADLVLARIQDPMRPYRRVMLNADLVIRDSCRQI